MAKPGERPPSSSVRTTSGCRPLFPPGKTSHGCAYLWGLAANGQAGIENVLDVMRGGIDSALLGIGKSSIHDLDRDDVVAPDGFFGSLGTK